jgi:hypothetical protein
MCLEQALTLLPAGICRQSSAATDFIFLVVLKNGGLIGWDSGDYWFFYCCIGSFLKQTGIGIYLAWL